MAKASVVNIPTTLPEQAVDGRWPGQVRYNSPTLIERWRRPPTSPVEAGPNNNMVDDENDGLGTAGGLILGVLIGASMWGAIGWIVWLLLDW
jgi:hypothetical protein